MTKTKNKILEEAKRSKVFFSFHKILRINEILKQISNFFYNHLWKMLLKEVRLRENRFNFREDQ